MAFIELTIDGRTFAGGNASGREAVGEHFYVLVRTVGNGTDTPDALIGKACSLTIRTRNGATMTMTGLVRRATCLYGDGGQQLHFEIGPAAEILSYGQNTQTFLDLSPTDIIKDVLKKAGLATSAFDVSPTTDVRPYTTQHREDDWSFVHRLMREEGLWSFYDHDGETSKLVLRDDSTQAESAGSFPHRFDFGDASDDAGWVSSISVHTRTATTKVTMNDRDPLKPALDLKVSKGDGELEVYTYPARAIVNAKVTKRAQTALETLRAARVLVEGQGQSVDIRCGKTLTVTESTALPSTLTDLFVVSRDWTMNVQGIFTVSFTAIPKAVPYRLAPQPFTPAPLGPETAFVRGPSGEEIQVDANGSAYAQPVWDRRPSTTEKDTIPQRVGQMALSGSMALPRIGWTTLVGHYEDDMDRPWIMSRLIDGAHVPPYKLPDNMTRTSWQTLTSPAQNPPLTEIVFEDKGGSEQIVEHAAKDMTIEIGDNEARTIGNRHVLEVKGDRAVTIDADDKLTVKMDQTTTVKGDEATTIEGNRSITVKGKEDAKVDGSRTEKAKADRTIDVGGNRTLKVTGATTATSKKMFTREIVGKYAITASATWDTQTDEGFTFTAKGDGEETVGAARTANGKNGVETLVKGAYTDSIAAAHTIIAKGSAGESSKGKMKLTVGAAFTAVAPEIEISAESEITIACGPATITIKSSEVTVKAPMLAMTGAMVVLDGAQVKHNP